MRPLREVRKISDRGIKIDYDGDGSVLHTLQGVTRINDAGKSAEIFIEDHITPQDILKQLVDKIEIRKFDLSEPSLHEIFIRAVGGETDE